MNIKLSFFNTYCVLTILCSVWLGYDLYIKEDSFFTFIICITKSKFYFCITLNLCVMILIVFCKWLVNFLYGQVRLTELNVSIYITYTYLNRKCLIK